jgi:hypothetical protein
VDLRDVGKEFRIAHVTPESQPAEDHVPPESQPAEGSTPLEQQQFDELTDRVHPKAGMSSENSDSEL